MMSVRLAPATLRVYTRDAVLKAVLKAVLYVIFVLRCHNDLPGPQRGSG